jgi:hypothetical protein
MAAKNKIVALKAALRLRLATLKRNSKTPDDTKIAIVPFNTVVKVGTAYAEHRGSSMAARSRRTGRAALLIATSRTTSRIRRPMVLKSSQNAPFKKAVAPARRTG